MSSMQKIHFDDEYRELRFNREFRDLYDRILFIKRLIIYAHHLL